MIEDALRQVDLLDKINTPAGNLSGGQKQRLAIARAVINKPAYIFADEPTGNLDTVTGDKVIELLFELNKSMDSTLAIVTHDPELAAKCQYQVSLRDGRIETSNIDKGISGARKHQPSDRTGKNGPAKAVKSEIG